MPPPPPPPPPPEPIVPAQPMPTSQSAQPQEELSKEAMKERVCPGLGCHHECGIGISGASSPGSLAEQSAGRQGSLRDQGPEEAEAEPG